MYKNLTVWTIIKITVKKIFDKNCITRPLSFISKPLLLQLGAQEYTCELILGNNVDLSKLDVTESLESWVVKCYKGKNCPSNVTTLPQIGWYLYSKLQCEFYKFSPTQAVWKYLEVIMLH